MADPQSPTSPIRTIAPPAAHAAPSGARPLPPRPAQAASRGPNFSGVPFWVGLGLSMLWVGLVALALVQAGPTYSFAGLPLLNWAIGISAVASPVGLIWMVTAYLQRAADIQSVAEPLRRQLLMITGESGAAEIRVRRFNQAVKEQIELLRSAQGMGQADLLDVMERARHHKVELEQFERHSIAQVKDIQDVIRRSMQHIEQLMEDKFSMMRVLDGKLVQSGDSITRQTESLREQLEDVLKEVESSSQSIAHTLEHALRDSRKLSDTAHAQETSLVGAAESAATTLQDLSGRIDANIARFLERAGGAREEAERLAGALDAQTRALDEFSTTLPARVTQAETVLRGVADRLHASEKLARDQALQMGEKLAVQVEGLQGVLDRFGVKFHDIDMAFQKRSSDLDGLVGRIGGATDDLARQMEGSVGHLGDRAQACLKQFAAVNEEARRGADETVHHLTEMAARYESVTRQMGGLSESNAARLKAITGDIADQLAQFESLQNASQQAAQDVQTRATGALQNLQHVLERLLAARDATQGIGETLTDKLRQAVEQNESLIGRLNESAQMTVRSLAIAAETLGRQEGDMATQTASVEKAIRAAVADLETQSRAAEERLRAQNAAMLELLRETQGKLDSAEIRLKDFAADASAPIEKVLKQINDCAATGGDSIGRYSESVGEHLGRLRQFSHDVSGMGEEVRRMTVETLGTIEQMNARFLAVRASQEETARSSLDQFGAVADRLQREIGTLGDHTAQAVSTLNQAATQVGQQSQQLHLEAKESGAKIQLVTSALQSEAAQIRAVLQKQTDELNNDLRQAELRFTSLGEALKQKTDTAYALLDRMAGHYNELTRAATEEFTLRAGKLEAAATDAHGKVEALNVSVQQQIGLIGSGVGQIETNAGQLVSTSARTLQQLSALNEKIAVTQEATARGAQQVVARLEETNSAFQRQNNGLNDAAQNAVVLVQKAGASFGEQTSKLLDSTQQIEQNIRSLNAVTTAFADQSTQIRATMEQHNQRLLASLNESVGQLDACGNKLQQTTAAAILGTDQASARYADMTQNASTRIGQTSQELQDIAARTDTALAALGSNIGQQAASLTRVNDQLMEQNRLLVAANETQKTQLVDLFDRLGSAHAQASEVADRTIARLSESLQQIQRQLGLLGDQSQTALAHVRESGMGFADQAALLLQNAQQAEQQARTVLSVTAALQDQARQLRETLHSEGERTGELLGALLGKLNTGNLNLRELGATAELTLTSLQHDVNNQTAALNGAMQQIADRQRSLTTALDAQRDVLNGLLNRLVLAHDETSAATDRTVARLGDGTQQIARQVEALDGRAQTTLTTLRNASSGFMEIIGAMAETTDKADQQARTLTLNAATLQEQARQMRESVQGESERTTEAMGSALAKLSACNAEMRDLGATAEMTITTLHSLVEDKTTALNALMQQTNERQRALASSLDGQRETLNGLLGRFTLAQDETVAVAERSVARLTDGAQQIGNQMASLDSMAQNALANVRAAGAGFLNEAGTLSLHAQQAEQQVRGLLSVTATMQDQARQLRESVQGDSARVIEQLNGVIAQLDATGENLRQQSNATINTMDGAALEFASLARMAGDTLQKQAEGLKGAAEDAENKVLDAGEKIRVHGKLMNEAAAQATAQTKQLADATEYATARLGLLRDSMADSDRDGRELMGLASARISEVKITLQRELQQVAEVSRLAVEQVMEASRDLVTQSDALRANLGTSESALSDAAALVREESSHLPAVLDRSAATIQAAGEGLRTQAGEASATLVTTADRFISVTGAVRDTLVDEMRHLGGVADSADQTLRQFNQAMIEQIESIKAGTGQLSEEQAALVEKSARAIAHLSAASDRLAQIRTDALQTTERLARDFEAIEGRTNVATQRLTQAGEALARQSTQMAQGAERAEGQITAASQSFREQLERVRTGVQMQIDDINRGLMQITAQLERTGGALRTSTSGTLADVEKISGRFDQIGRESANVMADRTARMRVVTEEVAKLLGGFSDQIDVLLNRLAAAGDGLKRNESGLIGQLQTALSHLASITERLEANRTLTASVSEEAIRRLSDVATAMGQQLHEVKEGSETVTGIIKGVGRMYTDQTQGLNKSVVEAQSQVLVMNKSIEDMQQRTDRLRVALKLQGEELMGSLEQILRQLSATGDAMTDTVEDVLKQQAAQNLQKIS